MSNIPPAHRLQSDLTPAEAARDLIQFTDDSTTIIKLMLGSLQRIATGQPRHGSAAADALRTIKSPTASSKPDWSNDRTHEASEPVSNLDCCADVSVPRMAACGLDTWEAQQMTDLAAAWFFACLTLILGTIALYCSVQSDRWRQRALRRRTLWIKNTFHQCFFDGLSPWRMSDQVSERLEARVRSNRAKQPSWKQQSRNNGRFGPKL